MSTSGTFTPGRTEVVLSGVDRWVVTSHRLAIGHRLTAAVSRDFFLFFFEYKSIKGWNYIRTMAHK